MNDNSAENYDRVHIIKGPPLQKVLIIDISIGHHFNQARPLCSKHVPYKTPMVLHGYDNNKTKSYRKDTGKIF